MGTPCTVSTAIEFEGGKLERVTHPDRRIPAVSSRRTHGFAGTPRQHFEPPVSGRARRGEVGNTPVAVIAEEGVAPAPIRDPPHSRAMADISAPGVSSFARWHTKEYDNGIAYEGELAGGKWQGLGRLTMTDGERYEGFWRGTPTGTAPRPLWIGDDRACSVLIRVGR